VRPTGSVTTLPETLLETLNEAQRRAVAAPLKPVLVLAGAGTGKTRVLVHRIAYLAATEGIPPYGFLAVTFTHKAAEEMARRVVHLLGRDLHGIWLGTFHSLCHRLLQRHACEAGLPEPFQLIDEEDQRRLIRQFLPSSFPFSPKAVQHAINRWKDRGLRSGEVEPKRGEEPLLECYRRYEAYCLQSGLVDFGELLLRSCELLEEHGALREQYRRRFQAILIDEFQDTNPVQFRWAKLLARDNLFVVGDDDQAIYSWRGADVENLFRFREEFPNHLLVRLEQNYRSTAPILETANRVIAHNRRRIGKTLWTDRRGGEPVDRYRAEDEWDEAEFVVCSIRAWLAQGRDLGEVALLYRSHALSRPFELALQEAGIPYRIYGGIRFLERAEVKDALAYLRLLVNRNDDLAFLRAAQKPPQGIGQRTLTLLQQRVEEERCSLWQAAVRTLQEKMLPSRSHRALAGFLEKVERLAHEVDGLSLSDQVEVTLRESGLREYYEEQERGLPLQRRVENLNGLVNWAESLNGSLKELVTSALLMGREDLAGGGGPAVQLMTLHAAKGLEFPLVFLVGLEEEIFPGKGSGRDLEEERRLFYVGITRAKEKLCLSYARRRILYGRWQTQTPSRFLQETYGDLQSL